MKKKNLHAEDLYTTVRRSFCKIEDHRKCLGNVKISILDALMSGLAVFALKSPSLLSFEYNIRRDTTMGKNLRKLFSIETPASDVQMRTILDAISPESIRAPFRKIFAQLQRANVLKKFRYLDEGYLIALDGTGYFSSSKVRCDDCIEKKRRSGEITYHHQLLGASVVHPEYRQVIPLCPEAISNGDGGNKQDCELKATQRWMKGFRAEHSKLDAVILGDALFSNASFINLLSENNLHYILGVKPGKHKALFEQLAVNNKHKLTERLTMENIIGQKVKKKVEHSFNFINGLSLNTKNPEIKVNVLEYTEQTTYVNSKDNKRNLKPKVIRFTWITDMELNKDNVVRIMKAGRSRWKVENETFKTLKSETAYNLEHSYGHGKKNLCTIFGMLAMLSFLIDQSQEIACPLFRKALAGNRAHGVKRTLWELFKSAVEWITLDSWEALLKAIAEIIDLSVIPRPAVDDSS